MTREEIYQIVKAALAGQARETEKAIATVVKRLRDERAAELAPLQQRVAALERDLALTERIARLERAADVVERGADPIELPFNPRAWRSGGNA